MIQERNDSEWFHSDALLCSCFLNTFLLSQVAIKGVKSEWITKRRYIICAQGNGKFVLKGFCQDMYIKHSTPLYAFQTLAALHPIVYRTNSSSTLTKCFGPWSLLHSLEENTKNAQRCKNRMPYTIDNTTPFTNQFAQLYAMVATAKAQGIVSSTCTSWRTNYEKQLRPVLPTPHHGNSTAISGRVRIYLSYSILFYPFPSYRCFTRAEVPTALCLRFASPFLHYHSP